jgi:alpha-1,3-glucosyltransferase
MKQVVDPAVLVKVCSVATVLAALPSMVQQMVRPSRAGLLYGMANSAMAFYMLSYQVRAQLMCGAVTHKALSSQS